MCIRDRNAADGTGLVGSGISATNGYQKGTSADPCSWSIFIFDELGYPRQEVDYTTLTCDLSFYGGGASESLTDGTDLINRLDSLTGGGLGTMQYIEHYDIVRLPANHSVSKLQAIVCQ